MSNVQTQTDAIAEAHTENVKKAWNLYVQENATWVRQSKVFGDTLTLQESLGLFSFVAKRAHYDASAVFGWSPHSNDEWWGVDGDQVFGNGAKGPSVHFFGFGSESHGNNSVSFHHALLLAIDHIVKSRPELFQ